VHQLGFILRILKINSGPSNHGCVLIAACICHIQFL
jgi:hypothetical protein